MPKRGRVPRANSARLKELELDTMAQQKPDREPIDEFFKLVDQLTAEEQDELDEQMKLRWLRRVVEQADKSVTGGNVVFQSLY